MSEKINDLRIHSLRPMLSPALLIQDLPLSSQAIETVTRARAAANRIISGQDKRLLVVVGPCSIHDTDAAFDYGTRLKVEAERFADELCIIMRVYFEKPRTTIGWRGLINDPSLDGSFDINHGLYKARKLLLDLNYIGLPAGTEFLDSIIPQFISDAIAWGAIGARTTESQMHRELASGLSMPVGFKNGTDGNVKIAIDAVRSARHPHHFFSISSQGVPVIVSTMGNEKTHIILRGSSAGPNYDAIRIEQIIRSLEERELPPYLMVDCSHGNSGKEYQRQSIVADAICQQVQTGSRAICGVMLESNLLEGRQDKPLEYGKSITDACLSWKQTVPILEKLALAVRGR